MTAVSCDTYEGGFTDTEDEEVRRLVGRFPLLSSSDAHDSKIPESIRINIPQTYVITLRTPVRNWVAIARHGPHPSSCHIYNGTPSVARTGNRPPPRLLSYRISWRH